MAYSLETQIKKALTAMRRDVDKDVQTALRARWSDTSKVEVIVDTDEEEDEEDEEDEQDQEAEKKRKEADEKEAAKKKKEEEEKKRAASKSAKVAQLQEGLSQAEERDL